MYSYHIDDQEGWKNNVELHLKCAPGDNSVEEDRKCEWNHKYEVCKYHLAVREYGQDESVYYSDNHPSSRSLVSGQSHAMSKSKGLSRMISAFKDYSSCGMWLRMNHDDRTDIDGEGGELKVSPGIVVIESIKDTDKYWIFEKKC